MTMPYYVAPEQVMKDRAEYAQKGIARGRSLIATTYDLGIAIVADNPSRSLHKISEIYDRIAFAGVGKYNEFDQLRVSGIRHADTKGYAYSREDVDARSLANLYAQYLGQVFTHEMKPLEVEILVAELGTGLHPPQLYHIAYEGTITDEDRYAVLGGETETIAQRLEEPWTEGWSLTDALRAAVAALAGPDRTLAGQRPRGGRPGPGQRPAGLPAPGRRRTGRPAGLSRSEAGLTGGRDRLVRRDRAPPHGTVRVMDKRIYGLENEYGVTCTLRGQRRLSPDEVARYLFRRVVSWGRSSNVFLENGARLYLDVGSHPEYATPECDDIAELVAHDKAGEWILSSLVEGAEARLREEGIRGRHLPVQEQHRLGRQLLRLPRELPDQPAGRLRPLHRGAHPVPGQPPGLRRRRQGAPDGPGGGVLPQPAGRAHLGGGVLGHHPEPAHHQHPGRAPRRRREVPAAPRHRGRLQHERVRHLPQGRAPPASCCACSRTRPR